MQSFDNIIICGDFNVHFSQSNHNCIQFLTFMCTYNLVCADLSCNIKYTYRRDDYTSFSWPDHILTLNILRAQMMWPIFLTIYPSTFVGLLTSIIF